MILSWNLHDLCQRGSSMSDRVVHFQNIYHSMHEHVWKSMSSIMSCHSLYLGMLLPCTIISSHDCQCCLLIITRVVHVHNPCAWCFARYVQTMAVFFQILRYSVFSQNRESWLRRRAWKSKSTVWYRYKPQANASALAKAVIARERFAGADGIS